MTFLSKATSASDTGENGYTPVPGMNNRGKDDGIIYYNVIEDGYFFHGKLVCANPFITMVILTM